MPAMATSVAAPPTMEAASAAEFPTAVKAAAPEAFMIETSTSKTVMVPASSAEFPAIVTTSVKSPPVPTRMTPIPVIPRSYADKYTVFKPFRAVETVGCAGVRVIIIVAVCTNWRWAIVAGADSHTDKYSLRARKRRKKEANA